MIFDMPQSGTWERRGGWAVNALAGDFNLTLEQAAGIVGNLGFESIGFTAHHEIGQAEGVGGYGWAQWTGPRRTTFFAWCSTHGLDQQSDEANYGYLCQELRTTQSQTIVSLRDATTLAEAVWSVGRTFERPAGTTPTNLPGYTDRVKWAHRALVGASTQISIPSTQHPEPVTQHSPLSPDYLIVLQAFMKASGDYTGGIDGLDGSLTRAAVDAIRQRSSQ